MTIWYKQERKKEKYVITTENLPGYRKENWDGRNLLPRKNKARMVIDFVLQSCKRLRLLLKGLRIGKVPVHGCLAEECSSCHSLGLLSSTVATENQPGIFFFYIQS